MGSPLECTATQRGCPITHSHRRRRTTSKNLFSPMLTPMVFSCQAEYQGSSETTFSCCLPGQQKRFGVQTGTVKENNNNSSLLFQVVWTEYSAASEELGLRAAAYNTCSIWKDVIPYVTVMRPMTDLCHTCQLNSNALIKAANNTDEEKSVVRFSTSCRGPIGGGECLQMPHPPSYLEPSRVCFEFEV